MSPSTISKRRSHTECTAETLLPRRWLTMLSTTVPRIGMDSSMPSFRATAPYAVLAASAMALFAPFDFMYAAVTRFNS